MSINAIDGMMNAAAKTVTQPSTSDTNAHLVEKFDKLMSQGTSEISTATGLVTKAGNDNPLSTALNELSPTQGVTNIAPAQSVAGESGFNQKQSPEAMLGSQLLLGSAVVQVDLVSKVAGSLSQSINKLVSLQ